MSCYGETKHRYPSSSQPLTLSSVLKIIIISIIIIIIIIFKSSSFLLVDLPPVGVYKDLGLVYLSFFPTLLCAHHIKKA